MPDDPQQENLPSHPLMAEMIKRALANTTLQDAPTSPALNEPAQNKSWLEKAGLPAYLAGAGADWVSTGLALRNPNIVETNPLINWVPSTGGKIALGAGIDLAQYLLARELLKNHPKILGAGLLGTGIRRGIIAGQNISNMVNTPEPVNPTALNPIPGKPGK